MEHPKSSGTHPAPSTITMTSYYLGLVRSSGHDIDTKDASDEEKGTVSPPLKPVGSVKE